tara:strand:- start:108 stop:329 length:222 start_codon:yes stop_codon:yes gene_type:complete
MKEVDLHGISHELAEETIRSFLNFADLPCVVTTGNSPRMKQILKIIVEEYGWRMREPIYYNKGSFIIEPKTEE